MTWARLPEGPSLWYEEVGSGTPVVFVGGWTGMVEMWSPVASTVAASVSGGARCVSYDLRGNGRSDKLDGTPVDVERHATDLAGLLDVLEITDPVLVGHSLGAMITLAAAASRSDVRAVVLTGGFPTGALLTEIAPFDLRAAIAAAMPSVEARVDMFVQSGAPFDVVLETSKWPTESVLANAAAFLDGDVTDYARQLGVPTLLLHGKDDIVAPAQPCAVRLNELIGGSHLTLLDGGHCLMLDDPDTFAGELTTFIDGLSH